jgi:2-oxoglutarate ferredoxin oxidoreductase subunit delta
MRVRINTDYCKGCDLCTEVCPRKVFEKGEEPSERGYIPPMVAHPEKCPNFKRVDRREVVCEMCILTCPDQAIDWDEGEVES